MFQKLAIALTVICAGFAVDTAVFSAGNLAKQKPIEVRVELGTKDGGFKFIPNNLTFETGKLYKLVLSNPSQKKHYFTSLGFASMVYTRKVQVMDGNRPKAEIKGTIREIEVYPGSAAEWWFVPVATGKLDDLYCHIKEKDGETHAEKGMTGTINIE